MKRLLTLVLTVGLLTLGLSACGSGSASTKTGRPVTIHLVFSGSNVTVDPAATRIQVGLNQKITLSVHADARGEIHVHSSPEHAFEYAAGSSDFSFTIDKPGVVEVESHSLEKTLFQLEVS